MLPESYPRQALIPLLQQSVQSILSQHQSSCLFNSSSLKQRHHAFVTFPPSAQQNVLEPTRRLISVFCIKQDLRFPGGHTSLLVSCSCV
jgi:hypothetical protein